MSIAGVRPPERGKWCCSMCAARRSRWASRWAKVGCAVQRNRIKRPSARRMRAAAPNMKPGLYVFIARQPSAEAEFEKLGRSMQYLLRKQNLLLPDGQNRRQPAAKAAAQP